MAQEARDEFKPGDHVSWKYGVGKATGRIIGKVTEDTKLGGRTFRATPDDPKYRMAADKSGKEVVRRGAVLSRIEESAESAHADDKDEASELLEHAEHSEESDEGEPKKADQINEAHEAHADENKSKEGEQGASKIAGDEDADKGSEDPPSSGTAIQDDGGTPKPTIKAGLITGTGGDEALPSEADEDIDLTKHSAVNDATAQTTLRESTVDSIPMEDESAWQLGNQPDVRSEQKHVGRQDVEGQGGEAATLPGSEPDGDAGKSPHRLPHEEVPQPAEFGSPLLRSS